LNPDFEALAPLYALDALDGEDLALFTKELDASESLRALVREYRDAASALPLSLAPVEPSPALKSRILASAAGPVRRSAPVFTRVFWAAAALVLFALLIRSFQSTEVQMPMTGKTVTGQITLKGRMVKLELGGLPALPAGKVYQLWHIGPIQKPVDQGTFVCDGAGNYQGWDKMKYTIDPKDAFAITMEPAGGSKSPTMPILASAQKK
jgi:anti-sigma-K factor RskA